jgi:single-strand DNA-binding protein
MNIVHLCGRLGSDPELRYTAGGTAVCKVSLATTTKYKGTETTEWHRLIVWGKLAEVVSQYLKKGQQAIFHGRLTYNKWEKDGVKHTTPEIVVESMEFVGNPGGGSAGGQKPKAEEPEMDILF